MNIPIYTYAYTQNVWDTDEKLQNQNQTFSASIGTHTTNVDLPQLR